MNLPNTQISRWIARRRIVVTAPLTTFILSAATILQAASLSSFAVFGHEKVTYAGWSTTTGPVGTNGNFDKTTIAGMTLHSLQGLGSYNGVIGFATIQGTTTFNGDVIGGLFPSSSAFVGGVSSGGNAVVSSVSGNVVAAGNVTVETFGEISGNVIAGNNLILQGSNKVLGTAAGNNGVTVQNFSELNAVRYGNTFSQGVGNTIGSVTQGSTAATPTVVQPVNIPHASSYVGGGANQSLALFEDRTLAPGHYGALSFTGSNELFLSAGNYYFDSVTSLGSFTTIHYNLSGGPINVFVTGDIQLLSIDITVNGLNSNNWVTSLARNVYWESHGNVIFDNVVPSNGSEFFGTIFTPNGDITTGVNEDFVGALLAGGEVIIKGTDVDFVRSDYFAFVVPEPLLLSLTLPAALCGMRHFRRRRVRR
jgi:hypothetical protein